MDHPNDLLDAIALIADFLQRSTPLQDTAALLRREVLERGMVPESVNWNGQAVPGSLPHARLLRGLPKDHLVRSLRASATTASPSTSLLASTLVQQKPVHPKLHQQHCEREIGLLIELRDERRRLEREAGSDRGRGLPALTAAMQANARLVRDKLALLAPLLSQLRPASSISQSLLRRQLAGDRSDSDPELRMACAQYRMLKKIQGHRGAAYCLSACHPEWIFTGADDGLIRMWNPRTSQLHAVYRGNRQIVTDICNTADLVASAAGDSTAEQATGQDNTVRIWEIGTTKLFACLTQHKKPVQRVQFSPNEKLLFSSAEDGTCAVWNVDAMRRHAVDRDRAKQVWMDREREKRLREGGGGAEELTEQEEIQLELDCVVIPLPIDAPLVFPHCKPRGGGDWQPVPLVCMAVHPSGKYVATGGEDALGRVWSVDPVDTLKCPAAPTRPNMLSGAYKDGSQHLVAMLTGHTAGFVHHIEFSHRGDRVLTFSDKDGTARVWFWPLAGNHTNDFASKPQQVIFKAWVGDSSSSSASAHPRRGQQQPQVHAAAFSQLDDLVITSQSLKPFMYEGETAFWDSKVCVWDSKSGALLRFMRGHRMEAPIIRMHPECNWLGATCGADGLVLFWDFAKGELVKRLDCISLEGYAAVCDAKWCNSAAQNSPVDFAVTDSMHRLCLIGTGTESLASRANPPDQFLSNEMGDIIYHPISLEPMDSLLQIPLYLMRPAGRMVDAYGDVYAHQPPPIPQGQGSYFARPVSTANNLPQRLNQAAELTKAVEKKEANAREAAEPFVRKQEELIEEAVARDLKVQAELLLRPVVPEQPSPQRKPKPPASTNARKKTAKSGPLLALERAMSLEESEEEEAEIVQQQQGSGRKRRRAALRANRSIHRHTRSLAEQGALINGGASGATSATSAPTLDNDDEELEEVDLSDASSSSSNDSDRGEDEDLRFVVGDDDEIELLEDSDDDRGVGARRGGKGDEDLDGNKSTRKQKRYKTRGKKTDYSHFYDGKAGATTTESAAAAAKPPALPHHKLYCDEWLTTTSPSTHAGACFVPQRGDEVVYFPQGHLEYLTAFPSDSAPPWHAWDTKEWPYVLCRVTGVDYVFPAALNTPSCTLCRVSLAVIQVKSPPKANSFFSALEEERGEIAFTLDFHPFGSEFLVLHQRFLHAMQPLFQAGTRVRCLYVDEHAQVTPHLANVLSISERDAVNWPESPWEAVECQLVDDSTSPSLPSYFSPWDIEPVSTTTTTTTTTTIPFVSPATTEFWECEHDGEPVGEWIAKQIQSCPFPLFALSKRKMTNKPCDLSVGLVTERLFAGQYYRQWDALYADLEKAVEYASSNKDSAKSREMLLEFKEICQIARGEVAVDSAQDRLPFSEFQSAALLALDNTSRADREGYFALPVDADEVPDYYEVITHPMDFATIRAKILDEWKGEGEEVSFSQARSKIREVVADVKLMALNAMTYNSETSLVFRRAKDVVKRMTSEFSELKARVLVRRGKHAGGLGLLLEESEDEDDDDDEEQDTRRGKYSLRSRQSVPPPPKPSRHNTRSRPRVEEEELVELSDEEEDGSSSSSGEEVEEEEEEEEVVPARRSSSNRRKPISSEEEEEEEAPTRRSSRARAPAVVTRSSNGSTSSARSDEAKSTTTTRSRSKPLEHPNELPSTTRARRSAPVHEDEDEDVFEEEEEEEPVADRRRSLRPRPVVEDEVPVKRTSRSRSKPLQDVEELPRPSRRSAPVVEEEEEPPRALRSRNKEPAPRKPVEEEEEEETPSRRTRSFSNVAFKPKPAAVSSDEEEETLPQRRTRRPSAVEELPPPRRQRKASPPPVTRKRPSVDAATRPATRLQRQPASSSSDSETASSFSSEEEASPPDEDDEEEE